jgi:hypothetical protein
MGQTQCFSANTNRPQRAQRLKRSRACCLLFLGVLCGLNEKSRGQARIFRQIDNEDVKNG